MIAFEVTRLPEQTHLPLQVSIPSPNPEPNNPISQPQAQTISDWPRKPQALKRFTLSAIFSILGDLILFCAWLAILAFGIAVLNSDGVARRDIVFGDEALAQGQDCNMFKIPTLSPILFTATVGRRIKLLSMYRVERGERLEVLDRLIGSTTFMGALAAAFTRATLSGSFIARLLALAWALSPCAETVDQPTKGEAITVYNQTRPQWESRRIVFDIAYWKHVTADCLLRTTYVETEVTCQRRSCVASGVRQSLRPHLTSNHTFLDEETDIEDYSSYLTGLHEAVPGRASRPSVLSTYLARMLGIETTYWIATAATGYVLDPGRGNYTFGETRQAIRVIDKGNSTVDVVRSGGLFYLRPTAFNELYDLN
ncbi:hypothetical protein QBC44DRAFT_363950 [Cladorrhinum sp. PSN332]|nr:hypothetical protein QBC44DRAFT_363950 [Cladorrhinum sp. PSN332]